MKKSEYSDSYQMHEQRGTFNGIDTCNLTSFHNFSFRSKLLSEAESRAIINRHDINALLSQLTMEKKISTKIANDKRRLASQLYGNFDFEPFTYGATYIPLEVAMAIQDETNNPYFYVWIDDRKDRMGNQLPPVRIKIAYTGHLRCSHVKK